MARRFSPNYSSLVGNGVIFLEPTEQDKYTMTMMNSNGEAFSLDGITAADIKRLSLRLKDALDLVKEITRRKLLGLLAEK